MVKVYLPPFKTTEAKYTPKLFLAGSIEMGKTRDWQSEFIEMVDKEIRKGVKETRFSDRLFSIFNPRRKDWNSKWEQEFTHPEFSQQVNWELENIEFADSILFYFDPKTKSPISLMELGSMKGTRKSVRVVCPEGYWRKGNVDIFCERERIRQFRNLREAAEDYVTLSI